MANNGRGKYAVRANVNIFCERSQAHALEYFPMFRAVREANKRNEGEARAHSAAAQERASFLWLRIIRSTDEFENCI